MRKKRNLLILGFMTSIWFIAYGISIASTDTKSLIIKASIGKAAKLIIDTNTITFPNMGPDEMTRIPATQNDIKVVVKTRTGNGSPVTLNIIADGDLTSGSDTIPVQNVTWQGSGPGFLGGTLSKTAAQTAGSWIGSGVREGAFRYYLNSSWNYQTGEYQVTITYSLVVP